MPWWQVWGVGDKSRWPIGMKYHIVRPSSKDRCWKRFVVSSNIWIYVINPQNVKQDDVWRSAVEKFFSEIFEWFFSIWPTVQIHFKLLKNLLPILILEIFLIRKCKKCKMSKHRSWKIRSDFCYGDIHQQWSTNDDWFLEIQRF